LPRPARVLLVGGGLIGSAAALELARAGAEVTVLEKSLPGAEASSAAAGILGSEVENPTPGPLLDLCRASQRLYPGWVRELERASGVHVGFLDGGSLELYAEPAALRAGLRQRKWQLTSGVAERLSRARLAALEPQLAPGFVGALYFPSDRRITPPELFRAVHVAARRAGVVYRSGTEVRSVLIDEAPRGGPRARGVLLGDGTTLEADVTVVAAGSWTGLLSGLPLPPRAVRPARGQLVELSTPLPVLSRLVFGAGVYLIPRADGRLLVGSTLEFVGYERGVTAAGLESLLAGARAVCPELGAARVERSWSNFRPYTEDELPLLGSAGVEGLIVASGHYRNGILLAPISAKIVASLALGWRPPLPLGPFDPRRTGPR
jgi:glycine oxidase